MKSIYIYPDHIHPSAKVEMDNITSIIVKDSNFNEQYAAALRILADSYHIYFTAMDILLRDGIVQEISDTALQQVLPGMEPTFIQKMRVTKAHPALKIATDAQFTITKLLIQFNLTPRSRKEDQLPKVDEGSPIDKFINKETR